MGIIVGEVVAPVTGDTSPFSRSLGEANSMGANFASSFGSALKNIGGSITSLGQSLTKYLTVPILGAAAASFKLGKDFEAELSKVTGLVGVASKQVDQWGADILKLAPSLGKAPKELAEALFFVTSAGIKGAEAMDVLEMSGKASAAGLGETKVVADLVTSAMNAYGKENLSASQATDVLVAAVREGKADASELAASMGQVLPIASNMGVTFDQVAAAQAAMTRTGTPATEAATQLKGILAGLIKPSKQAEEQLDAMGTSSEEMRKKIRDEGLIDSLFDLKEMTNKYGEEAMARVFPNIRALMGTMDLMGSSAESNADIFDKVKNSTGSLDEAFKAASETTEFKWKAALSSLQTVGIEFFNILKGALVPILETVVSVLGFVAEKFKALSPLQQQLILVFAGLAAAIGPILVVIGTAISGIGAVIISLVAIFTTLSTVIGTVGLPVLAALGAAFTVVAAVIAAVIAAVAAFIAGFVNLYKNNEQFRENVNNTWNSIKENAVIIFNEIKQTITAVLTGIKIFWKAHGNDIMNFVKTAWDLIMSIVKGAMNVLKDIIKLVCAIIRGDWGAAWEAVKSLVKNATSMIHNVVTNFWKMIVAAFKAGGKMIGSLISNAVKVMLNRFASFSTTGLRKIASFVTSMISKFNKLKSGIIKRIADTVLGIARKFANIYTIGRNAANKLVKGITGINFKAAGRKIVSGIISGIKSKIGELSATANQIGQTIRNKLPFSPAKEGPLRDLNKVNFSSSIVPRLREAEKEISSSFLGNMMLGKINPMVSFENFGGSPKNNGVVLNNANFNFHGVQDVISFMEEMRRTLRRYGGEF